MSLENDNYNLSRMLKKAEDERDEWKKSAMEQSVSLRRELANLIEARQTLDENRSEAEEFRDDMRRYITEGDCTFSWENVES